MTSSSEPSLRDLAPLPARYCVLGHLIDGWRVGHGGKRRRYCRPCNVLAVQRARARKKQQRVP